MQNNSEFDKREPIEESNEINPIEDMINVEDEIEEDIFEEIEEDDEIEEDSKFIRSTDERENAIEWYTGNKTLTVTLTQRKLINRILYFAEKYPDEVKVDKMNEDGTMLAHIPLKYLKFQRPRELSEEEKDKARERLAKYRK